MRNKTRFMALFMCATMLSGCAKAAQQVEKEQDEQIISEQSANETDSAEKQTESEEIKVDFNKLFEELEIAKSDKKKDEANPIITQTYGADPYALEYDGRLYIYMTADAYEKDAKLEIKDNSYSKIKTIRVVSTQDLVNFTDHGEIKVAGEKGVAKWANNSWAPAAAWKEIDGKPRFFLYFADAGGGIGVLQSDSPTGPFVDPIGHGLITRQTPNCENITWLFDPAVLVDDDGRAYIYFGGGVPEGKIENPGNARVAELGDDMISIKGEAVRIDVPYLFEDSGIHKVNNKYYYTYCSNWQVDGLGPNEYGITNAQIVSLESDSPMGPFKFKEVILDNPGTKFGLWGNNHHAVFSFKNQWYITYHSRQLERVRGIEKGYRCTHINAFDIADDGTVGKIAMDLKGCNQLKNVDPYVVNEAQMMANVAGDIRMVELDDAGSVAIQPTSGSYIQVRGVDFGNKGAKELKISLKQITTLDENSVIQVRMDDVNGDILGYVPVKELLADNEVGAKDYSEYTVELEKEVNGLTDLYFVFAGAGYGVDTWQFVETDK